MEVATTGALKHESGKRESGQVGTKKQWLTTREWTTWHEDVGVENAGADKSTVKRSSELCKKTVDSREHSVHTLTRNLDVYGSPTVSNKFVGFISHKSAQSARAVRSAVVNRLTAATLSKRRSYGICTWVSHQNSRKFFLT